MSAERTRFLPYGRQSIEADDIEGVIEVLRSDWLTTGPKVEEFERAMAEWTGCAHAVAVQTGTAALHCAMHALGVGPGDEVIVPAITFAATANCALYQGATPVFCDVQADTLLIDVEDARRRITPQTRAVIAVDYAGQPCDYAALRALAQSAGIHLVADACHALGASYAGDRAGRLAELTAFSFHPVKHITTGEGGMLTTDDAALAARARRFRNHGIDSDFRQREQRGSFYYEVQELGFNYRLSDLGCALGISQLRKLPRFLARRREIAARYDDAFAALSGVAPLARLPGLEHAYHLYVVRLADARTRLSAFEQLRAAGIGANVHYLPLNLHPLYRQRLGTQPGACPVAEAAYERILSLPMFPAMTDADVDRVIAVLARALA
jgi:perosamine synthetase